jgi:hypothetical protein
VGREVEQGRVEADRVAVTFQYGAAQIVIQDDPGHALPRREGREMAAQEILRAGIEEEAQEDVARIAQYQYEGHERAARATDRYVSKVTPVALCLFAGQRAQTQIGFRRRARAMAGDDGAEAAFPAAIAALANHRLQTAGGQRWELGQRLADERQVGIDLGRPPRRADARQSGLRQDPADGFGMHAQLLGDRSDAPFLDVIIAKNPRLEIRRNRHDRALFVCSDGPGDARSLAEGGPNSGDHTECTPISGCAAVVGCPAAARVSRRSPRVP